MAEQESSERLAQLLSSAKSPPSKAAEVTAQAVQAIAAPAAPAPAAPAKPPTPQERMAEFRENVKTIPTIYNGTLVEMPVDDVIQSAQRGKKAAEIEAEKSQWKLTKAAYSEFEQLMAEARRNPDALRAINDIATGRVDAKLLYQQPKQPQPSDDDEAPPASRSTDPQVQAELEAAKRQLAQLQQAQRTFEAQLYKRDYEGERRAAVGRDPLLAAAPEPVQQMAMRMIDAGMREGEFSSVQEAVPVVSAQIRQLHETMLESERQAREARKGTATVPLQQGGPAVESWNHDAFKGKSASFIRSPEGKNAMMQQLLARLGKATSP
jgi:hypothetical protein